MILTPENYYSPEANTEYMSVSQYHNFVGSPIQKGCEAMAMAILRGEFSSPDPTTAMLVGSYVDAYFEGTLDNFKAKNPTIFTLKGELRADFQRAIEIIAWAEKDELLMKYLVGEGQAQVIVTGVIGGMPWKGKIDRLHPGIAIVDGKVVASIRDKIWVDELHGKTNFIEAYGYVDQGAVYQELYRQITGEKLPFFIAALSKEKVPDKEIIEIPDSSLNNALSKIIETIEVRSLKLIKEGKLPPVACGCCDYCRSIKMLENTISLYDL